MPKKIDSRHTGAGAGIIGSFKNAGKIAGPIIGGLIIHWHDFSWMLWSHGCSVYSLESGFIFESLQQKIICNSVAIKISFEL